MDLMGIGDAARLLGLNASALRYYEERGLIRPVTRRAGKRMYDVTQLRRLVLVNLVQHLGVSLDSAGAILDQPSEQWRTHLREQIADLDSLIARAAAAKHFLTHALECPAEHPVEDCPRMLEMLDRRLAGTSFEQLATEYGSPHH